MVVHNHHHFLFNLILSTRNQEGKCYFGLSHHLPSPPAIFASIPAHPPSHPVTHPLIHPLLDASPATNMCSATPGKVCAFTKGTRSAALAHQVVSILSCQQSGRCVSWRPRFARRKGVIYLQFQTRTTKAALLFVAQQ